MPWFGLLFALALTGSTCYAVGRFHERRAAGETFRDAYRNGARDAWAAAVRAAQLVRRVARDVDEVATTGEIVAAVNAHGLPRPRGGAHRANGRRGDQARPSAAATSPRRVSHLEHSTTG